MGRLLTLLNPAEAAAYYAAGLWREETLYDLLVHWAETRPDRPALRDAARRLDWRTLKSEVDIAAAALAAAGLVAEDRVSVWTTNRVEAVIVFLACARNGYVYNTSLHHTYGVAEVAGLLERVGSRALFAEIGHGADGGADSDKADIFARAAGLASMRAVYALPSRYRDGWAMPAGARAFPARLVAGAGAPASDPDRICYLAFTSGTTGSPKGVMHSSNTLLANARPMVRDWGHGADTVLLSLSQMSHHIGTVALTQALVGGFELVLMDPNAGRDTLDWIIETGATYVMGVPTHAIDVVSACRARGLARLGTVSTFYMAGALIPGETAEALMAMGVTPQNVYGMTENGSHHYPRPTDPPATIGGSCGRACDTYEIRLFAQHDRDREVPRGEIGEIGGRGAMQMLGYFANQAATEGAYNADGWFLSGDLGRLDAQGNLHVVGRSKDMIIRGGHNIHPARIEDLAMRHAAVGKAAAIPIPDPRLGERVCLVALRGPERDASPEDILVHLHDAGLGKFDMPEYFAWVDALPLGPTGKILKHALIAWVSDGRLAPVPVRWTAPATKVEA